MPTSAPAAHSAQPPAPVGRWRFPLVAGVCFALGYGVVQRVMDLEFPQLVQLGQSFGVREFSGTGLEALRLRVGAPLQSIRGDLGVLELEQQHSQLSDGAGAEAQIDEQAAPEPQAPPPAPLLPQAAAPVVSDPSPPELAPAPGPQPSPVPTGPIPTIDLPDPSTP